MQIAYPHSQIIYPVSFSFPSFLNWPFLQAERLGSYSGGRALTQTPFSFPFVCAKITLKCRCFHGYRSFRYLSSHPCGPLSTVIHTQLATGLLSLLLRTDFFQVPAMEVSRTADGFPKPRDKTALFPLTDPKRKARLRHGEEAMVGRRSKKFPCKAYGG